MTTVLAPEMSTKTTDMRGSELRAETKVSSSFYNEPANGNTREEKRERERKSRVGDLRNFQHVMRVCTGTKAGARI